MSSKTVNIDSPGQFSELLKSSKIVVADFYADWCGPCKQVAPVFEQLSYTLSRPNLVTFVKVNTDKQKDIAQAYRVTALPTFIVFANGKVIERVQGADPLKLQQVVRKLNDRVDSIGSGGGEGSSSGSGGERWLGAELPRGYQDITGEIELPRCELLNVDGDTGSVRVLFSEKKPSALSGSKSPNKDWVESDTDEQMLLFMPFQSMLKLHTLQLTSLPPRSENSDDDDEDEVPMRPRTIKLFTNKPHNLGFEEAEDLSPTQEITLTEKDWNADGTANIPLRFVKFQNITSLVVFIKDGDGEGEKTRLDRVRLIGEAGEKREMGKLEKIGDEPGE
ncbi:putative thioredoxin protein [Thermochaetoides thermophila DSM 1495]|uniref:Putative thioredoxin protein n=1 Tax=Chaetomium thermophilum (strain DSM 1495 / CBS 144.50 / IMI 039719) TaxID=759272 RepID=G0SHR8_CHATD|nr:putative thioredoxin protein [Thermochaetoides thermophila DSM 1495]EGS16988.1 putative thioredoxin protein [Thermochaetoides thermophila DSM 1495]